jgi:hypothetical protein
MSRFFAVRSLFTATGFGLVAFAVSPAAQAHIRLLEPTARYDVVGENGIKSCPCGQGTSNRTCDAMANSSDPNRSARVTRAEAGSVLTLRFEEYVGHDGTYRVAFDDDGAEIVDFNANILVPMVTDPPGNMGNVGEGTIWEIDVTLPDMTCDNCTLQLIQAMNGQQTTPVVDPSGFGTYYTCVDLELVAPGTLGDGDPMDDPDDMEPGDGMDEDPVTGTGNMGQGTMGQGTMGGAVQPTDSTNMVGGMMGATQGTPNGSDMDNGSYGDGYTNSGTGMMTGSSSGGCSIGAPSRAPSAGAALVILGLASALSARCRRRAKSRH